MANSNLAGLRETFPSGDFTLVVTSGGSTTASTSLYYWVNGYSRGGMNLLTSLGQVTVSAGQKLVWTVTNKADGDDVFGWILSANTTNDPTVAKILCVARARETVNQDAVIDPPIAMQLTRDAHFALGATVVSLPTGSDLLDGMVRYQDGEYRQYNAETLEWETVNGWSTYLASTLTVLSPGLYKNGCDLPILSNQSIIPLPDYEGGTTPYLRLSLLNGLSEGTGTVLPTGTRLSLYARLNGSDDLGGQYLSGRVEIVPRQKTRRSDGTVTALPNSPITWTYGTPFYTLTSNLERGYALEFDVRVVGATLPAGVSFTFFVAEYGLLSQPTPATASGDLVYATGGKLRILPALLGAYRLDGAGVVDVTGETTSYPINANVTQSYSLGLQSDTANQKAAISGIGNGSIEFKTGALLPTEAVRAVVSTEAITCKPSGWVSVGAIAANASINLTVNYPCNASGKGTIRANYPDVIAGLSSGDFNPNRLRVFLRRNGSTITETTAIAVNPNTSQVFTISQVGTSATLPTDPGDSYNLWDYGTITGVSSISASNLPAGTYEVAIAYEYLGNRICKISHAVNDGCIPELAVSLSEATAIAEAYSDIYNENDTLQAKVRGLKFGAGFTVSQFGQKLLVTNDATGSSETAIGVTVVNDGGQNEFRFNGAELTSGLLLVPGNTYRFDQSDSSNATHPLRLSATVNGTHNGGTAYTTGVTLSGTPGTDGALVFVVPLNAPEKLYPYCSSHSLMGGSTVFNTRGGGASTANAVTVNATGFNGNLSPTDTDVQTALETIDGLTFSPNILPLGNWDSNANYLVNSVVHYPVTGNTYIANTANTNKIPGTDPEWSLFALKGSTGSAATVSIGTVTTGAAGSSASVTNVGTSSSAVFNITIPRGDTGVGSPGVNADMTRTSSTSNSIGTGSKSFTFNTASSNLGWLVGTRLRATASAGNFMSGVITAVSTTSVTINIDYTSGSGTYTSWNISIAGEVGATSAVFSDSAFTVQDNSDNTKQLQFELSGITTGTTRTLTAPDANGIIGLDYTLVSVKTSNYTAQNLEKIPCNTNAGGFTITTPASGKFQVIDVLGTTPTTGFGATGKNLTITPASGTIMGDTSLVLNIGAISPEFQLIGTDWRIVNHG